MEEREKQISDGLRFAEEVKIKLEDAERKHTETLKEASEEAQKTIASAREQAKSFEDQLRKDAEARAEDIVRKAREQMQLERQTLVAEARQEFAQLVVETATKVLDRELSDDEKTRFSESASKELAEASWSTYSPLKSMAYDKQLRDFAKRLVEFSLDKGEVSSSRVGEILQTLSSNPPRNYKPLLRLYLRYIQREIASYTARIEHAGPINESITNSIQSFLEKDSGRKINIKASENNELVAGLRVTLGDDIYEDSAAFRLKPLTESIL